MSGWYYWSHNRYAHFIVWRNRDNAVAQAKIRQVQPHMFVWTVKGPCWSLYEETESERTLEAAKQAVEKRVDAIIADEFRSEYVSPLR